MSGGSVTGGTGDIKPQILSAQSSTSVATTVYGSTQITLPVARIGQMKNRAMIMEVLKVYFFNGVTDARDGTADNFAVLTTAAIRASGDTSSLTTIQQDLDDPRVIAASFFSRSTTTSGGIMIQKPEVVDLTDGNGNGVLVATDNLFLTHTAIDNTATVRCVVKILYRLVNVSIQEYVGIVQSQQ